MPFVRNDATPLPSSAMPQPWFPPQLYFPDSSVENPLSSSPGSGHIHQALAPLTCSADFLVGEIFSACLLFLPQGPSQALGTQGPGLG